MIQEAKPKDRDTLEVLYRILIPEDDRIRVLEEFFRPTTRISIEQAAVCRHCHRFALVI